MILVKVSVQGEDTYYVVDNAMQVYNKVASEGIPADSVEKLSDNVVIDIQPNKETPEKFLMKACIELDVPLDKLRSPDRRKRLVAARKVISYHLRDKYELSYHDIADMLHRDHTSIIHNIREVEDQLDTDGPLVELLLRVKGYELEVSND